MQSRGIALSALMLAVFSVSVAATAQEGPRRAPSAGPSFSIEARRDSVVSMARQQLGRRYVFGGTSPRGFDCSGFTQYLMRAFDVNLPRTAAQQARVGREVPRDRSLLRPGDLLTFGRGGRVTHVGVYVGNGRYVHASSGQGRIVESSLDRPANSLVRAWMGVRRFMSGDSAETMAQRALVPQPSTTPAQLRRGS
ncbi:MAG TPA: C40 family peptidase [Longimicrobium sp.]|jgi:cell wall-associated NlpC family hydrolase|uniref:C40 family peptidase n=1 Tax=Longimicrobium sp. TaxID=2029185 RepID=UPI002ED818A0